MLTRILNKCTANVPQLILKHAQGVDLLVVGDDYSGLRFKEAFAMQTEV
jgi:hypothetical protein